MRVDKPRIKPAWINKKMDELSITPGDFSKHMEWSKQMTSNVLAGKVGVPLKRWTVLATYLGLEDWKEMEFIDNGRR